MYGHRFFCMNTTYSENLRIVQNRSEPWVWTIHRLYRIWVLLVLLLLLPFYFCSSLLLDLFLGRLFLYSVSHVIAEPSSQWEMSFVQNTQSSFSSRIASFRVYLSIETAAMPMQLSSLIAFTLVGGAIMAMNYLNSRRSVHASLFIMMNWLSTFQLINLSIRFETTPSSLSG